VWKVEQGAQAAQTVRLVPVKVGVFREDTVTIVSGIKAGEVVVTAGVHKLTPGQAVRVASVAAARK
jgi:multidrug efflux system membrane fusion protein